MAAIEDLSTGCALAERRVCASGSLRNMSGKQVRKRSGCVGERITVPGWRGIVPVFIAFFICALLGSCGGANKAEPSGASSDATVAGASGEIRSEESTGTGRVPDAPEVDPPERPAEMDRADEVGADAAAQYFLELYLYAYLTGDLTEWNAMSLEECEFCASVASDVESLTVDGGWADAAVDIVDGQVWISDDDPNYYRVDFLARRTDAVRHEPDGSVTTYEDGDYALIFGLHHNGQWMISSFDIVEASQFGTGT